MSDDQHPCLPQCRDFGCQDPSNAGCLGGASTIDEAMPWNAVSDDDELDERPWEKWV